MSNDFIDFLIDSISKWSLIEAGCAESHHRICEAPLGYRRPALTEIFAEINLGPQDLGTSFVELVTDLKPLGLTLVELSPIQQISVTVKANEAPIAGRITSPRVRCWNPEKTKLAQISKNQLVVNLIGIYPGWGDFRELFDGVLAAVREKVPNVHANSLTFNTIDKFSPPAAGFTWGRYINCGGPIVPSYFADCSVAADIIMGRGVMAQDGENRQFKFKGVPMGLTYDIHLQSNFQKLVHGTDNIVDELEDLHRKSTRSFEDIITDATRNDVMGGME